MPTLILSPRQTEDGQRLWRAAGRLGWRVERLPSWHIPADLRAAPEPVVYAEALMAPTLAEAVGLTLPSRPRTGCRRCRRSTGSGRSGSRPWGK
jgi:hypothetical protein